MKRLLAASIIVVAGFTGRAQADPQSVPMKVTASDIQLYAAAIRFAASQCGADKEVACQIGMNEKAQLVKLNDALTAVLAAQAEADKKAKK